MGKDKMDRRAREGRHIRLYSFLTGSLAWRDLSGNAVKALIYLATWEDGRNNGELFMSERMLAEGIGVSKRTAHKVFDELEEHGFIAPTAKGYFVVKRGPATCWRLTWLSWPAASKGPTNEYRDWEPVEGKSRVQKMHATGAENAPASTAHRVTGAEIAPVEAILPDSLGANNDPHTIATVEGLGWWSAERALNPSAAFLSVLLASGQLEGSNVVPFERPAECELCSAPFRPRSRGKPKRFCSERCRKAAEQKRARARRLGQAS